ncbi:hypothetical protein DBR32_09880 [Taibaiella sp. KBW10]|uniref:hypothetical protein n=1 Tax=Taibaiella sp. KBW10 TaxID=2153357 RepID=UPI000F5B82B6|nr:hypothetical protein [Taibaiella sp. KBW10]RQO31007.1 hypothetical protein DBR32_09880 [Taibaiella sp. KBW10]
MLTAYEEEMSHKERAFIQGLLEAESVGYFRTLRLMGIIGMGLVVCVGLIASLATPANELEKKFSLPEYILAATCFFILIYGLAIFGKKRFSRKFKADLRDGLKTIIAIPIQQKQFIPQTNSCHFHLNYPGLLTIQVSPEDFRTFAIGDTVSIEFAKHSKTYLGYF